MPSPKNRFQIRNLHTKIHYIIKIILMSLFSTITKKIYKFYSLFLIQKLYLTSASCSNSLYLFTRGLLKVSHTLRKSPELDTLKSKDSCTTF